MRKYYSHIEHTKASYNVAESVSVYYSTYSPNFNSKEMKIKIRNYLNNILNYNGYTKLNIPGYILPDLPKALGIKISDMAPILDLSRSKYYRKIEESSLDTNIIDKLSAMLNIYQSGMEAFNGNQKDFIHWLKSENRNLGLVTPLELLKTERGRLVVSDAIHRIEYNIYG